jgi:hypothetical protein
MIQNAVGRANPGRGWRSRIDHDFEQRRYGGS